MVFLAYVSIIRRVESTHFEGLSVHNVGLQDVHVLGWCLLDELGEVHRSLDVTSGSEHLIIWVLRLGRAVIQLNDSRNRACIPAGELSPDRFHVRHQ